MSNVRSNMMMSKVLLEMSISLDGYIAGPDVDSESPMGRGASGVKLLTPLPGRSAQRRSPDNIAAVRISCSAEAFSIPGIARSTRRWWGSRD